MNAPQQQPQSGLNRAGIEQAMKTGLKMLGSEDISTPNAWNKDLAMLEQFLINLLTGQLQYQDVQKEKPSVDAKIPRPPTPEPTDQSNNSAGDGAEEPTE